MRGCTVIGCWGCSSSVIDLSLVSVTSGFNVWKNQSFGITSNKLTAPEGVAYSITRKIDCASTGSLLRKISYRKAQFMPVPGITMLLSLLPLQHTDMIAAHGHRYRYHRLKQLDRDLFMRLIDPFYSCFLSFERS